MGEFLFVLHKLCVLPSGCCKVPIRRSRYKSKPSSSEVIRFTQNFVLLKHCWNCRCHQADGHRQSQDASRFCQPSISVISSGDPFFLQSCVTPTPQYFGQFLFHMWHISAAGADSSVRELASGGLLGGRRTSKHGQRLCLPGTRFGQPLINFSARFKNLYLSWE